MINEYKNFKDILLNNKNLNEDSLIEIINSSEKIIMSYENSFRLQNIFKENVKNGTYKNKSTDYVATINSNTKGKILKPNGNKTNVKSKEYILRMISAINLPKLFENAVYIDTFKPMKGKNNNNEIGYHHFVSPIEIEGIIYRVLITGKEKINSKILYSLNIEILPQKNGVSPLINTLSEYQSRGVSPSEISISNLVYDVKIFNYNLNKYNIYNLENIIQFEKKKEQGTGFSTAASSSITNITQTNKNIKYNNVIYDEISNNDNYFVSDYSVMYAFINRKIYTY